MSFECNDDEVDDVYDLNISLSQMTITEQISLPEMSEKAKEKIYKTEDTLNEIARQLSSSKYVFGVIRRYLCYLDDCFSGEVNEIICE